MVNSEAIIIVQAKDNPCYQLLGQWLHLWGWDWERALEEIQDVGEIPRLDVGAGYLQKCIELYILCIFLYMCYSSMNNKKDNDAIVLMPMNQDSESEQMGVVSRERHENLHIDWKRGIKESRK